MSASAPTKEALPHLETRDDYIAYFDDVASGQKPIGDRRSNLVKSYLLETSRHANGDGVPLPGLSASRVGDSALFRLQDGTGDVLAVIDDADTRFPVVHSTIGAVEADKLVREAVVGSPHLDHVWLPGKFFDGLWQWTKTTSLPHRIAKLVFAFTAKYEQLFPEEDIDGYALLDERGDPDFDALAEQAPGETRRSQFAVEDRVEILDHKLLEFKQAYAPLQSTIRMRVPSSGHGGHEIYNTGKITNWSSSFAEQVKIIRLVVDIYRSVTEDIERSLWYSSCDDHSDAAGAALAGQPVLFEFPEALEVDTLQRWADQTFGNKRNSFRLGGEAMWSGEDRTRLHVYGVDRHLWQPISLEATKDHFLVLLPEGTCGNTINRLATRIQETLCPTVRTWLGDRSYEEILQSSASLAP